MKAINQSKYNSERIQQIIANKNISDHVIQLSGGNEFYSGNGLDKYKKRGNIAKTNIIYKKNVFDKVPPFLKPSTYTPTKSVILDLDRCSPTDILYAIPNSKPEHKMGKSNHYALLTEMVKNILIHNYLLTKC